MIKAELVPMTPVQQDQIKGWLAAEPRFLFERALKNVMDSYKIGAAQDIADADEYTGREFDANKKMNQAIEYRNFMRTLEKVSNNEFVFSEIHITSV